MASSSNSFISRLKKYGLWGKRVPAGADFDDFIGRELLNISLELGYVHLTFEEEHYINIINEADIAFNKNISTSRIMTSFELSDDEIRLIFGDSGRIIILYKDENFLGPEAFGIKAPSGSIFDRAEMRPSNWDPRRSHE